MTKEQPRSAYVKPKKQNYLAERDAAELIRYLLGRLVDLALASWTTVAFKTASSLLETMGISFMNLGYDKVIKEFKRLVQSEENFKVLLYMFKQEMPSKDS